MKNIPMIILHGIEVRKVVAVCLLIIVVVSLVFPRPVKAQPFLVGLVNLLKTVYEIIKNDLGKVLNQITDLTQWFNDYYQIVLFPKKAIEAARGFVVWMSGYFQSLINQVLKFPIMSSTLPTTQPLEALVRNGSLDFSQLSQAYRNVYGSLPAIADASPLDRNLIDLDDALALNSMKGFGIHEATFNLSLGTANEIEDKIKDPESAPGAAPFLSAAGTLASLETQAMIQKMIAAQLRQEAALLAHHNALLKRDVILVSQMRGHISNLLNQK